MASDIQLPLKFDAGRVVFYLGSFFVPALLVVMNQVVRKAKDWSYTSGSDFLLMLMTVSFSFAALAKDVSPYIRNQDIHDAANAIFLSLGIIILIAWYWTVSTVEVAIHESIRENKDLTLLPQLKMFFAWVLVILFTGLEFVIFLVS